MGQFGEDNAKRSPNWAAQLNPPEFLPLRYDVSQKRCQFQHLRRIKGRAAMMMCYSSSVLPTGQGRLFLLPSRLSPTPSKWVLRTQPDGVAITNRTKGQAFRLLANPNVSSGREDPINGVVMVDPLEAKRLAAKQMQQLKAKEKFQRRREIEAINGAWAMIGLTAGLVIEGQTGKGILGQLVGYVEAVFRFFVR